MQEKDIAEKEFVSHNDVFSDIVNGFLFHGRQVVDPDELGPASCHGYYIEKGKLHETVRDEARTVQRSGLVVLLVGIENQSIPTALCPSGWDATRLRTSIRKGHIRHSDATG